jgi:hypothetical protein
MKKRSSNFLKLCACLFLMGCILGATTQPLSAQVTIPQGSMVNSAVFSVFIVAPWTPNNQTVTLHRITADWGELSVNWTSFADQFDPSVAGSFVTDSIGWHTVNLTNLVQAWVNGIYPNFGIAMMQGVMTPPNVYYSSEAADPLLGPKLEIGYTTPAGELRQVTIPLPEAVQDGVADAFITQQYPYHSEGNAPTLITGNVNGYEKYSLIRFHFTVVPSSPGTGSPGYWKNHPEAWPDPGITIGGVYYSMEDAISLMKMPVAGDKTYTMFPALVAAKLNVAIGNDASCIASTITAADNWMMTYPVGSGVAAGGAGSAWRVGEPLYLLLDQYNNGLLCAPHRD